MPSAARTIQNRQRISVDQQNVQLVVWLGVAVLALGWANLEIWRVRRALAEVRRERGMPKHRAVPQGGAMTPAPAELTSPVMAQ